MTLSRKGIRASPGATGPDAGRYPARRLVQQGETTRKARGAADGRRRQTLDKIRSSPAQTFRRSGRRTEALRERARSQGRREASMSVVAAPPRRRSTPEPDRRHVAQLGSDLLYLGVALRHHVRFYTSRIELTDGDQVLTSRWTVSANATTRSSWRIGCRHQPRRRVRRRFDRAPSQRGARTSRRRVHYWEHGGPAAADPGALNWRLVGATPATSSRGPALER